jgi:hypothetical protein
MARPVKNVIGMRERANTIATFASRADKFAQDRCAHDVVLDQPDRMGTFTFVAKTLIFSCLAVEIAGVFGIFGQVDVFACDI